MATKKKFLQASGSIEDDYWIALLGGSSSDLINGISVDSSENIIVTGRYYSSSDRALVAKYDSSGSVLWSRTLDGSASDRFFDNCVDSQDNIICVGYTGSDGAGGNDALIAKYNSSGVLQWAKTLGSAYQEQFNKVAVDSLDNIYAVGLTSGARANNNDWLIAKYNSSGVLQNDKYLGEPIQTTSEYAYGISIDSSDNIFVSGTANYNSIGSTGSNDILVAKYNSSLQLQSNFKFGGTSYENSANLVLDSSGNIIVGGPTGSAGAGGADAFVAKFNSSGTLQWAKVLGTSASDSFNGGVTVDSEDNIILMGYTSGVGAGSNDALIAKVDSSGSLLWSKTLGGTASDLGYQNNLIVNSFGTIIFGAITSSDGAGSNDLLIAKVPPDGSGNGTYGSIVYQDVSLTVSSWTPTVGSETWLDSGISLTDATAVLTDAAVSLTEELFEITP